MPTKGKNGSRVSRSKPGKSNQKNNKKQNRERRPGKFSRLRGMRDIFGEDMRYWELAMNKINNIASVFGFKKINTPMLEDLNLYLKSTGETTDIVGKEMYSFVDKNGDKVAIRPELTPGIVRSYIENGMFNHPQPVKLFSHGPIFRHEKPQAGRYRQSYQLDFEIFGEESPMADLVLIMMAYDFFSELQTKIQVQINSIGCPECRPKYVKKLLEYYKQRGKRSKLCLDCKKRINKNPLRLLDCKEEACREIAEEAPPILDHLCDSCRSGFMKVLEYMDELEINYNLNSSLVRGLDYYNGIVFEITEMIDSEDEQTKLLSLGGGGRYDSLVESMGGRPTPACGFALGLDRVVSCIRSNRVPLDKKTDNLIFLAQLGDSSRIAVIKIFEELRKAGMNVAQAFTKNSLKGQLEEANRLGAGIAIIMGQKEVNDGTVIFRDMDSGNQELIDIKKIRVEIEKRLKDR